MLELLAFTLGWIASEIWHIPAQCLWRIPALAWLLAGLIVLFRFTGLSKHKPLRFGLMLTWGIYWNPSTMFLPGEVLSIKYRSPFIAGSTHVVSINSSGQVGTAWSSLEAGASGHCQLRGNICRLSGASRRSGSWRTHIVSVIRVQIERRIDAREASIRPWFRALILGDLKLLGPRVVALFRNTGMIHLLVISGFHISLFSALTLGSLSLLLNILYGARVIPSDWHLKSLVAIRIFVGLAACVFAALIGLGPASQRAAFVFLGIQLGVLFARPESYWQRLEIPMLLQMMLFPIHFFSLGNLMSWFGCLLLLEFAVGAKPTFKEWVFTRVICQCCFLFLAKILFGTWSLWGLILNLVVIDFFSVLVLLSVLSVLGIGTLASDAWLLSQFQSFTQLLANVSDESFNHFGSDLSTRTSVASLIILVLGFIILRKRGNMTDTDDLQSPLSGG